MQNVEIIVYKTPGKICPQGLLSFFLQWCRTFQKKRLLVQVYCWVNCKKLPWCFSLWFNKFYSKLTVQQCELLLADLGYGSNKMFLLMVSSINMQRRLHLRLLFGVFVPSGTASSDCRPLYIQWVPTEAAPQFDFKWLISEVDLDTVVYKLPVQMDF